ncbi:MAG: hypothetical protein LBP88_09145 [Treponema sp.]|jgi:hypothetical protein|nr:hypothetical protein [Treponema sp.]
MRCQAFYCFNPPAHLKRGNAFTVGIFYSRRLWSGTGRASKHNLSSIRVVDSLSRVVDSLSRVVDSLSRVVDNLSRVVDNLSRVVDNLSREA